MFSDAGSCSFVVDTTSVIPRPAPPPPPMRSAKSLCSRGRLSAAGRAVLATEWAGRRARWKACPRRRGGAGGRRNEATGERQDAATVAARRRQGREAEKGRGMAVEETLITEVEGPGGSGSTKWQMEAVARVVSAWEGLNLNRLRLKTAKFHPRFDQKFVGRPLTTHGDLVQEGDHDR